MHSSAAPNPFLLYTLWLVSACANKQNWNRIRKKIFKWRSCWSSEFNSMRSAKDVFVLWELNMTRRSGIFDYDDGDSTQSIFPAVVRKFGTEVLHDFTATRVEKVICCHIRAHISVYEQSIWRRLAPIRLLLFTTESVLVKFMRRMKYEEYDFLASSHHCLSRRSYTSPRHFSSSGEWVTVPSLSQFASSVVFFFVALWSLFCFSYFFFLAHHFSMRDRICWFLSQVLTWKCWKCWW